MTAGNASKPAAMPIRTAPARTVTAASISALGALLLRDAVVLRKHLAEFVLRTLIQPFLLVFVFLYVFPKIGQGVGGSGKAAESAFATVLVLECRVDYRWHGLTFSIAYERVLYVFQVGSDFLEAFTHSLSSMRVSIVKQAEEGMKD